MEIEFKDTLEKCLSTGVNLFTGAGFSVLSSSRGRRLPVGDQLKAELLEEFSGFPSALELPQLCTLISRTRKDDLRNFFVRRFKVDNFDEVYRNLFNIQIKNIFTTNVDDLVQNIYKECEKNYVNDVDQNGISFHGKDAIDYYYLHGSIVNQSSELVFGDLQIASIMTDEPSRWAYLRKVMSEYPTIFWGYALRDAGTLNTIAGALDDHGKKNSWIIVHPEYLQDGEIDYYRSLGLKIIKADTYEILDYFGNLSPVENNSLNLGSHPYPEYEIPSNASVEHRAIQDFFQGATPDWSDIYSARVVRSEYYDTVINLMDGGSNVLITGEAASGKSTLLMQVAASYSFEGFKYYLQDVTGERMKAMLRYIDETPAMFFIDDCQSSLEALTLLAKSKNARYVVAERDYAYLSSSNHEFYRAKIEVVDVTEVSEGDASRIYESIPVDVKNDRMARVEKNSSLFEFIERNCKFPTLKERFESVISQLEKIDSRLVELFLLICYMHRARSVASMDILLSYFNESVAGYEEVYQLIETLGASVREYAGDMVDSDQDYFNIRSNMLADLISDLAPVRMFSLVLSNFHNNVSRYSIPNYDAFKRRAYDARLFERAFPDIDDGVKVYDVIYKKHASPFNLQQKALYLSRRMRHDKAFPVIDEAVAKAGSKNWSIKNSYAIIKFRANIERKDSAEVRKALDDSMELLETCYTSDARKTFHAMTYADHVLRYWKRYRDEASRLLLEKSIKWLESEMQSPRRIHNVKRLLRDCKRALQSF